MCTFANSLDPDQAWQMFGLIWTHAILHKNVTDRNLGCNFTNTLDPDHA